MVDLLKKSPSDHSMDCLQPQKKNLHRIVYFIILFWHQNLTATYITKEAQ